MKITIEMLKQKGACSKALECFRCLFGDSAEISVTACVEVADKFDWDWAAVFLKAPAQAEYDRMRVAAWADYECLTVAVLADFDRVKAAAWARGMLSGEA